jgi:hypothetical protein
MMYPSLIGGFAVLVLIALVTFIVPVFVKVFKDFGGDLPTITKVGFIVISMYMGGDHAGAYGGLPVRRSTPARRGHRLTALTGRARRPRLN